MPKLKLPSRTALSPIETRSFSTRDATLNKRHFEGHAAVFNQRTAIGNPLTWGFYEQVAPGCFSKSISERADVIFDQDHNLSTVLARVSNDTLRLAQDSEGLATDADWADVSYAADLQTLIEGRFITGMSFMFQTVLDKWEMETVETNGGLSAEVEVRTLLEVKLIDVCVTSYPAYAGTDANMRSAALTARSMRAGKSVTKAISPKRLADLGAALRVGATLSADTLSTLQDVLDLIAAADNAVDQAQPILASLMGVPNPDADDERDDEQSGDEETDDMDEMNADERTGRKPPQSTSAITGDAKPPQSTWYTAEQLAMRHKALATRYGLPA